MSRLSELLNPTNKVVSPTGEIESQDDSNPQMTHRRQQSLTSPLEALAIAASTSPTQTASIAATIPPTSGKQSPHDIASETGTRDASTAAHGFDHQQMLIAVDAQHTELSPKSQTNKNSNISLINDRIPDQEQRSAGDSSNHLPEAGDQDPSFVPPAGEPAALAAPADGGTIGGGIISSDNTWVKMEAKDIAPSNKEGVLESHPLHQGDADASGKILNTTLKQEGNGSSIAGSPTPGLQSPKILLSAEPKKRVPTKTEKKKGTASVIKKPASKKRKMEIESKDGTPFSQRSATPTPSHASKTPGTKGRNQISNTPAQSSPPQAATEEEEEEEDDIDDSELFCICRKPDDHTWMIACDGGCEDWFHGRCVNMDQQNGKLIDKYICPNCSAKGGSVTTWKPMCRLETCREPARVSGPRPSKYCSDAHGELYMRQRVRGKGLNEPQGPPARKRRKDSHQEVADAVDDNDAESAENDKAHLRGGILQAGELKALTSGVGDVEEFRTLGNTIFSPKIAGNVTSQSSVPVPGEETTAYTPEEESQLEKVSAKKATVNHKLEVLKNKDKFLNLVRARVKGVVEELKAKDKGIKDVCGFDSRISWSDEEFDTWRMSIEGKEALESGVLNAPAGDGDIRLDADGDARMTNGDVGHLDQVGRGACLRKRCERHKKWFQLHNQEVAFERDECRQQMNKLDKEEKGIKQRAMLRILETGDAAEGNVDA